MQKWGVEYYSLTTCICTGENHTLSEPLVALSPVTDGLCPRTDVVKPLPTAAVPTRYNTRIKRQQPQCLTVLDAEHPQLPPGPSAQTKA